MKKQTVLVTGASSGIGKSTALLLNEKGYNVYASARNVERMKELAKAGIHVLAMDVSDDASMVSAVEAIGKEVGGIDILINNAGYGSYGALEDVPMSEARYQFEVNVFGLARLTQLALPYMRTQRKGRIINVSSMGGKIGEPHGAWYHATKFAVEGLSDSLRMELLEFNIDVVVIQPGAIKTEWSGIAQEKLLQTSGNTAYKELAIKHAKMLNDADKTGSDPMVIAKTIAKAVEARRPKTRYYAGKSAWFALTARKLLSDRMFDRLMLNLMK